MGGERGSRAASMARRRRRLFAFRPFAVASVATGGAPRARSGHRIAAAGGALWLVGGYNPAPERAEPVFRELWRYGAARARWRRLAAAAPALAASSAACLAGRQLLVFGGTGAPFGRHCSNRLHVFDTALPAGDFRAVPARGSPPLPQYGQAILYTDGHLYVVGGTDGLLYTIDVHRLNLQTLVWETVFTCTGNRVNEPEARYRHELAFDGSNLYILAGGTADCAYDFVNIPIFSLETFTWSFKKSTSDKIKGYPPARKCHSAVQIDKNAGIDVFVMGGFDNSRMFNDLWRLEIPSLQWTLMRKSSFPYPLYFHSSAVTPEGCMYTFGGIQTKTGDDATRSNKLYKLWLSIPKLSEICWESLLFYYPNIVDIEPSKLLKCGIPIRFVERIDPLD